MCTRKKEIFIRASDDLKNIWKMPRQLASMFYKNNGAYMLVKCGKCDECRLERVRNWTYKIWLESLEYDNSCFVTLTYADDEKGKLLNKKDLVNFIKRLRKKGYKFKYFASGEYGEKKGRAHYHIIFLGWQPNDIKLLYGAKSKKGKLLYHSKTIQETWGMGRTVIQPFGKDEISYITLYTNKNGLINSYLNEDKETSKKDIVNKLKVKYGVSIHTIHKNKGATYIKVKNLKDLDPYIYKAYKKEYYNLTKNLISKVEPEFSIYSKGLGYNNFIKKEYWKYDLILDKFKYEIPKEFLIKALENEDANIKNYITHHLLERKKYAEQNYIDPKDKEAVQAERLKEEAKRNDIINNDKLNKKFETKEF